MIPRREFESFDGYDSGVAVLAANALFQTVIQFNGRPDAITIQSSAAGVNIRLRNRGASGGTPIRILTTDPIHLNVTAEIVEAQDPAGGGTQVVSAIGRFSTRGIDTRETFPGPDRNPTGPEDSRGFTQTDE